MNLPTPIRLLPMRFVRELAGAAACGTASALLWLTLGTLWTWAVDVNHHFALLSDFPSAAIAVPAFALGWLLYLVRTTVLQSRVCWMLASTALTLAGSLVHRAIFFDDAGYLDETRGFVNAVELALAIMWRVTTEVDASFLTAPPVASWGMVAGSFVAALLLSAATYRRVRAWVER